MTMKRWATRQMLRGAATLFVVAGLAACGEHAVPAKASVEGNGENPAMRTEVPLTRPIALDKAGEVVNVEFVPPPPGPNAYSGLMLGVRIGRPDAASGTAMTFKLVEEELAAKVRLIRVEEGAITMVPLRRSLPSLRDQIDVPPDGGVPGLTNTGVDTTMLQDAGLLDPKLHYDVMQFAMAENIQPGHYRLTINLDTDHPGLQNEQAELLVAYFKKAK